MNDQPLSSYTDEGIASQNKRFLNFLIDTLLIYLLLIFSPIYSTGFLISIPFLYYLFFEIIYNKTPGKFLTKTLVKRVDGKKLRPRDVVVRTLSRYIPFEIFTFLGNKNPVGWHDKISKTRVVSIELKDKSN